CSLARYLARTIPVARRAGTGGGDVGLHEPDGLASDAPQPPPVRLLPVPALPRFQMALPSGDPPVGDGAGGGPGRRSSVAHREHIGRSDGEDRKSTRLNSS